MTDPFVPARPAVAVAVLGLALAAPLAGQVPAAPAGEVTLERIMADPEWLGRAPEEPYWADDGESVFYLRERAGEDSRELVEVSLDGRELRVVDPATPGTELSVAGGDWDDARRRKVYERDGDLFLKDVAAGTVRQLTRTAAAETAPRFLADGRRITYDRGGEIFVRELDTGLELQPVVWVLEEDPEAAEEDDSYLVRQQERLFEVIRERKRERELEEERERAARRDDPTRPPPPFYLGEGVEVAWSSLSPSGEHAILALQPADAEAGRQDLMPEWVTESGYVETHEVRPKVGTGDGSGLSFVLLDLVRHERHDLDVTALPGIDADRLAELRAAAERAAEARQRARELEAEGFEPAAEGEEDAEDGDDGEEDENGEGDEGDGEADEDAAEPRTVFAGPPAWTDDGRRAALVLQSIDNKDRWIATLDLADPEPALASQHHLHDPAWIGWDFNEAGWLADGRHLWYLSEETGFSRLYRRDVATGETRELAGGEYLVSTVTRSPDGRHLYYLANDEHPGIYEVHRVPAAGGAPERLTDLDGLVEYALSPQGDRLLLRHSKTTRPPELSVQPARPGAAARQITREVSDEFAAIDWVEPEIVPVPSSHVDRPIWSRLYLPPDFDPERPERYPAVLFVHGAGYLQNAHLGWSYYFREFMFHTLLARHGYVVLDMDYRASAGYGRDWRTAIYRRMGTPELEDFEDGIDWLVENRRVDPERVGIYGGSYGGFMTFMALFVRPDLFAAGASLRPVTDWAHYNHPYTSNILNVPELDPEAYERSSPIELAEGLEDPLLIIHGMQDDNVLFEDTVRLVQRLIELEKEDWEVAIYPVEPHGFEQPSSWLDAYRRIFKLFERYLK